MVTTRKNKDFNPFNCPVTHFLNVIGGKWKIMIIYGISKNCNRFSLLQKALPHISKQMLVNQLRELEEDKIIDRIIYAEIPPRVEYSLTELGKSILPVVAEMQKWGTKNMENARP